MSDEENKENKPWMIRDVPEQTRRKVKVYAAEHGVTMAQALESMIESVAAPTALPVVQSPEIEELIRDMSEHTQRLIALYASERQMTWAHALEQMVDIASDRAELVSGTSQAADIDRHEFFQRRMRQQEIFFHSLREALDPLTTVQQQVIDDVETQWGYVRNPQIGDLAKMFAYARMNVDTREQIVDERERFGEEFKRP